MEDPDRLIVPLPQLLPEVVELGVWDVDRLLLSVPLPVLVPLLQ